MALFTGKGDDGTTKTFNMASGVRMSKGSALAEALGSCDEVNSYLGSCKVEADHWNYRLAIKNKRGRGKKERTLAAIVHEAQNNLFTVQAELAGAPMKLTKAHVTKAELIINTIEKEMPPITTFFISGGTELAARFDVARTLARRAERRIVGVHEDAAPKISKWTLAYINRLSSLLYALARYSNHLYGITEEPPTYQ